MNIFPSMSTIVMMAFLWGGVVLADIKTGEAEFKEHCAACHPDGGNVMNPQKTLSKKDLTANKIKTTADVINIMRNPGPGMTPFDKKTLPDGEAKAIAEYILKSFK